MTEDFKRKLTAILSADVVGYSRLMGEDEAATVKTLETYKGVISSLIKQHRGRVVDSPGDNLLAEFGSVVDAVQCAVSIQKELQTRNTDLSENRRMEFRIGINLGDVIEEENRIYGDGVNIAARLEALADPGGICISKTAFDHIESKLPLGYEFLGEQTVKNISKPVGAYRVLMETRVVDAKTKREAEAVSLWKRKSILSIGIIVILAIVTGLVWMFYLRGQSFEPASVKPEQEVLIPNEKEAPKSIAVMPFADHSPKEDQAKFALGLSEEIITAIDNIPGLRVTGSTSSFSPTLVNKTIQDKGIELGVDHILEGSVIKDGDSLRITTRLVSTADGSSLWTETYKGEFKDIFKIYGDIAKRVADKLKLTLEAFQLLGGTENVDAYEKYLFAKGQNLNQEYKRSLESINMSISLDPEFANARILKSVIHWNLSVFDSIDRTDMHLDDSISAAQEAIQLEPKLAKGYLELGYYKGSRGDFIEAELYFRKAIEMQNEIILHNPDSVALTYLALGFFKKTRNILMEARRNDPRNIVIRSFYLLTLGILGDTQEIEKENERCKLLFGDEWKSRSWGLTYHRLGTTYPLTPDDIVHSSSVFNSVKEYLDSPEKGLAKLYQLYNNEKDLGGIDITEISLLAAHFGDYKFALDSMEKRVKYDAIGLFNVWYPVMKDVRQLPRFKELMREVGLVDYWKEYGWPDLCRPVGDDDFECH